MRDVLRRHGQGHLAVGEHVVTPEDLFLELFSRHALKASLCVQIMKDVLRADGQENTHGAGI